MILSVAIGSVTTIVTVLHVLSLPLSTRTALMVFADVAPEEASTEQPIGNRWNSFLFLVHPYLRNRQTPQHVSANRSTASRVSKRNKGPEFGKLLARARGSKDHKALTSRYHAEKGSGYG